MKALSIHYTPRAEVEFTREDLLLLMECSANHYDGRCKDCSSERLYNGQMGLVYGMLKTLDNGFGGNHILPFRDLDTMAKILEVGSYLPDKESASRAFELGFAIKKVLVALNESVIEPKSL